MKRFLMISIIILALVNGCKDSKTDLAGNETVKAEDFIKAFPQLKMPFIVYDTALQHFGDTLVISKAVFTQFIPDSALNIYSESSNKELVINPAGIIHNKERDFLLAKFSSNKKTKLGVFVLDDKHKFLASIPLLNNTEKDKYIHSLSVTEEPTFILKKEKLSKENTMAYSRNGFAYSAATNSFGIVLHDSNEDTAHTDEIINPIDTLPSTAKFSGDYISNKKNFISIRDGKNASSYFFFIHFEKNNGGCTGELKGSMSLNDEKSATFSENGDACVIDFKFSNNSVNIKEQGNCGNHRGITCPFDFTFKKKNQTKKKAK